MAKYQITQKVWEQIMGTSPSCIKGKNLPVESITWSEAAKFCNSLSELEGLTSAYISVNDELCLDQVTDGYRLPSIVQFGYAIEGGRKSCGEWSNGDYGWTDYNSGKWKIFGLIRDQDNPRIHPVGQKKPNKLGIYDLYGNVSEWCNDWAWFDEYINQVNKQQSPLKNPIGPDTGRFKVACGENAIGEDMAVDFEDFYEYEGMYSEELCPSNMYSGHIGFRVIKPL